MKINKLYIVKNENPYDILDKLLKKYGINNYKILKNENGKPYIENNPIYFNISNKDNISVIYISDKECGVDIEKKVYNEKIMKHYYLNEEINKIKQSSNKEKEFTKIWVKKEAYVKMIGIGLSYGLKNVNTLENKYKIRKYKDYYIATCIKI